jgi:hypothetical protein
MPGKPPPILATVPGAIPGGGRPDPPADLDVAERKAWRAIVASLPDYWIDQAGELVLECLCAQVAVCSELERRLRRLRAETPNHEAVSTLSEEHAERAKAVCHLLTQLRATPRSRVRSRAAGPQLEEVPQTKPWDTRARRG